MARHAELASIVTRASGRQGSLWKLLPDWDSFMDHLEKATYNNQPNLSWSLCCCQRCFCWFRASFKNAAGKQSWLCLHLKWSMHCTWTASWPKTLLSNLSPTCAAPKEECAGSEQQPIAHSVILYPIVDDLTHVRSGLWQQREFGQIVCCN